DRRRAREDGRGRRAHARAPAPRRPVAGGVHRAARAARPPRPAPSPGRLTRIRSALKQRVGAILAKNGIARPYSNLFGPGGSRFLAELELRAGPRRRLDGLLALIAAFDREIETTTKEIEQQASADAYVDVLCQIRGVGRYIAMLVIAEVGDVTRFPS